MGITEEERERLIRKEHHRNPGGALNDAMARATIGSPSGGCLLNLTSIIIIVVFVIIVRACSN